jgi:NAD+ synthase
MEKKAVIGHIVSWLQNYSRQSGTDGFVVGISGGIDSAVTSALCAMTGLRVIAVSMPIRQGRQELDRSNEHIAWLKKHFSNVESREVVLDKVLEACEETFPEEVQEFLVMANTRARLRMTTLYAFAGKYKLLLAGTGNKIEDFGIGFFTKYGDGGVDLSPIADLNKTEVYALASELGVPASIQQARPTDGLFADGRTDEDQIGASYPELEWAMAYHESGKKEELSVRQKEVLAIYLSRHRANKHKMEPVPVCIIPKEFKKSTT